MGPNAAHAGVSALEVAAARRHTWTWDGTTWTERTPATSPPGGFTMVYDRLRGRVILNAGGGAGLWEWNGATWTRLALSSPKGAGGPMSYDVARRRYVVFTSATSSPPETWELGTRVPQSVCALGSGCPSADPPALAAHGTPMLGNADFALDLVGAQALAPCWFGVAAQGQSVPIGGCTFYLAAPLVLVPSAANAGGFATLTLPLPSELSLSGIELWSQGFALDAAAPIGLAFTGALHLTLGE